MKTKTYFAFRIDVWDDGGNNVVEHFAGPRGSHDGGCRLPGAAAEAKQIAKKSAS
jgi:hypothetical protein